MPENDVMSVVYTETDNGVPCLCFCSDLMVRITNKTMAISFCNYMANDMAFKINNLQIQNLSFTYLGVDMTTVKAKVNGKFEFMGYVHTQELYDAMKKVVETLQGLRDES